MRDMCLLKPQRCEPYLRVKMLISPDHRDLLIVNQWTYSVWDVTSAANVILILK